ncbi:hypothetical protein DSAG12_02127 [Promethearchaeum syntrophicum]|uniref:C2H2-type domain-containing protein n=1 Tax=Promethearchaeum syntrophicum TaxID=2594042 RepID=A0A5B9DBR7_9ARCH|nr:hypothetical protein [Candidatus Prometheoarchaeum syntrophicum]QEE16297.1 hypothetical protein DSAG12_02127 [Candidatus Prometheoarchaeum syntrophicum]
MGYICSKCGKEYTRRYHYENHIKKCTGTPTKKKITKKKAPVSRKSYGKKVPENIYFADLILFNAVKSFKKPDYLKILEFCSSFDIKTDEIISKLQNRIRIGDIKYHNIHEENIQKIITDILNKPKIQYPFIIPIQKFPQEFPSLNFNDYDSIIQFLQRIIQHYPGYLQLSSSKLGFPPDLVTFNHLFPNSVFFSLSNRWRIEK